MYALWRKAARNGRARACALGGQGSGQCHAAASGTQHAGRTRLYAWWSGQRVSHAVTCARVGRAAAAPISCDEELQRGFWAAVAAFKVIL